MIRIILFLALYFSVLSLIVSISVSRAKRKIMPPSIPPKTEWEILRDEALEELDTWDATVLESNRQLENQAETVNQGKKNEVQGTTWNSP